MSQTVRNNLGLLVVIGLCAWRCNFVGQSALVIGVSSFYAARQLVRRRDVW